VPPLGGGMEINMATIYIGSARHDENGKYSGGQAGDQKQNSTTGNDMKGEVSIQAMYKHTKGWLVFRPRDATHAGILSCKMTSACNNKNIGYDQGNRLGIITAGIDTKKPTEGDCSSLVRECIIEATGIDPGNFSTADEAAKLKSTGLFEDSFAYVSQEKTPVYNGDVLVTKTKGHTAIVVSGSPRGNTSAKKSYYSKYTGSSNSLTDALAAVGEADTSKAHRAKIAKANGITGYTGTATENTKLLALLKVGKLIKA
jgi:hypothetical protein